MTAIAAAAPMFRSGAGQSRGHLAIGLVTQQTTKDINIPAGGGKGIDFILYSKHKNDKDNPVRSETCPRPARPVRAG